MKWLLLVLVLTTQNTEVYVSIEKMIEIETDALCKAARKTVVDDANSQVSSTTLTGICIQVRE